MKKILVVSDFHCGHVVGLTPPGYYGGAHAWAEKAARAYWNWFETNIRLDGPFDIVFANGDLIDGKGEKSGGTEQITTNRETQMEMAVKVLRSIPVNKGAKFVVTRGTPYHTGSGEDWENQVAAAVGAKIGEHEWVSVEGVTFDLKHHPAGGSSVPQGRHTAVARDRLWNVLWSEKNLQPKADIFIRSHVHYHTYSGGPEWLAMTTPALQGFGSKYGARRCSGMVDFGFVTFEVNKGEYSWQSHVAKLKEQKATLTKL